MTLYKALTSTGYAAPRKKIEECPNRAPHAPWGAHDVGGSISNNNRDKEEANGSQLNEWLSGYEQVQFRIATKQRQPAPASSDNNVWQLSADRTRNVIKEDREKTTTPPTE